MEERSFVFTLEEHFRRRNRDGMARVLSMMKSQNHKWIPFFQQEQLWNMLIAEPRIPELSQQISARILSDLALVQPNLFSKFMRKLFDEGKTEILLSSAPVEHVAFYTPGLMENLAELSLEEVLAGDKNCEENLNLLASIFRLTNNWTSFTSKFLRKFYSVIFALIKHPKCSGEIFESLEQIYNLILTEKSNSAAEILLRKECLTFWTTEMKIVANLPEETVIFLTKTLTSAAKRQEIPKEIVKYLTENFNSLINCHESLAAIVVYESEVDKIIPPKKKRKSLTQ